MKKGLLAIVVLIVFALGAYLAPLIKIVLLALMERSIM